MPIGAGARHRCRKPREPMPVFLAKGIALAAVVALVVMWLAANFTIGYSPQQVTSLPWRVWVVHKGDVEVERGDYVAFRTDERMDEYFPVDTQFIKQVIGVPGDHVEVRYGAVLINGEPISELPLTTALGKSQGAFARDRVIAAGHYWVMGTNPLSYDSRYWGTVSREQVIGQGYPIW